MPLVTTRASVAYGAGFGKVLGGGSGDTGAMFPISAVTLTTNTSSISFSNIPQTYTHLELRYILKGSTSASGDFTIIRVNGDGDINNYVTYHFTNATGSAISNGGQLTGVEAGVRMGNITTTMGSYSSTNYATGIISIFDYKNTNKTTIIKTVNGYNNDAGSAGGMSIFTGLYLPTTAVTSFTISPNTNNLAVGSSVSLYGIKGA